MMDTPTVLAVEVVGEEKEVKVVRAVKGEEAAGAPLPYSCGIMGPMG